jgi:urocanate hydratase
MASANEANELQRLSLRAFTALYGLRPDWRGALVLSVGLDVHGAALAVASHIAGAVSLAVDSDAARIREIVRSGVADFVVNTLDEAIRTMKNEIRRQTPLSVALAADPAAVLEEALERGLAPQVFASFACSPSEPGFERQAAQRFHATGAELLQFDGGRGSGTSAEGLIGQATGGKGWRMHSFAFDSAAELRTFDARALSVLEEGEGLRRRWLEAAPRVLQRQRPPQRWLWLNDHERNALSDR